MPRALLATGLVVLAGLAPAAGAAPATGVLAGRTQISFGCPGPAREGEPGCNPWRPFANARLAIGSRVVRSDAAGGFTLGVNVGAPEGVDAACGAVGAVPGAELLEEPFDSPHGFRGFSFRDPEGNLWDVAWKRGSAVTAEGDLTWAG